MVKKEILNNGVSVANSSTEKQLTKITGTLTSQIQLRGEGTKEPYYYSFIKLKGQQVDLPVIFKSQIPDALTKGAELELTGHYSTSHKNVRKSFTACSYQILNEMSSMKMRNIIGDQKRIRKKCFGCDDPFTCSQSANYDYCKNCELNGSRYVNKEDKCPECGDGSGIIKFPNQAPRNCKTCHLAKKFILDQAKSQLPEFEKELEQITQMREKLTSHD